MNPADAIKAELIRESQSTLGLLEAVPGDKLGFKPHPKSQSLGQLAFHIAEIPGLITDVAMAGSFAVPKGPGFDEGTTKEAILELHHASVAKAVAVLESVSVETIMSDWSFTKDGRVIMAMPKLGVFRTILLNHLYHHRGQLSVYLRLLDVPVPSVYGPTADVNPFA